MPAISTVTPSGIPTVDYVDSGTKWAVNSLTYSFPTSASFYTGFNGTGYGSGEENNGFKAFTAIQQAAVTSILGMYSSVANLTFTLITETSTQSADIRYAESNLPSTAWGYYPTTSPEGGDAWFNNSKGYGFITSDEGVDAFVHYSDVQGEGFKSLEEGDQVEFELTKGPKGAKAVNVTKV